MGRAAAITKYEVQIKDDKRHHGMQRTTLITATPRLYMLSSMATEIPPLNVRASIMVSLPRLARPTASGPEYFKPESRADSGSALQT